MREDTGLVISSCATQKLCTVYMFKTILGIYHSIKILCKLNRLNCFRGHILTCILGCLKKNRGGPPKWYGFSIIKLDDLEIALFLEGHPLVPIQSTQFVGFFFLIQTFVGETRAFVSRAFLSHESCGSKGFTKPLLLMAEKTIRKPADG